ncbi:MAG TPA: PKD domain-containing protein, partial [Saprospiraceae bacterium]|nr:PKD domain-containing protein [Saprospiraceae bacterium]
MKTLISTLFFTLFLGLYTLQSQDRLYIIGAMETCIGSCETYTLDPPNSFIENVSITYLDSPNTNDCYNATVNNQSGIFTVCYNCIGTYYIDVLAFTNTGTILTDSIFVNVSDISQIKIFQKDSIECHQNNPSDDCLKACAGSTVTYGYSLSNPFLFVIADVVGATSYVLDQVKNEITVTWGNGGFGGINLTTLGQGTQCFTFGSQCIEITDDIEVDFNIPGFAFCVGESIEITPLTLDGISYSWDFGNGNISSDIAPVVSYDKPGTYQVSLTIITACGCTASITKPIIIK